MKRHKPQPNRFNAKFANNIRAKDQRLYKTTVKGRLMPETDKGLSLLTGRCSREICEGEPLSRSCGRTHAYSRQGTVHRIALFCSSHEIVREDCIAIIFGVACAQKSLDPLVAMETNVSLRFRKGVGCIPQARSGQMHGKQHS